MYTCVYMYMRICHMSSVCILHACAAYLIPYDSRLCIILPICNTLSAYSLSLYIYIYIYTHIHVCVYIYIYIYIHTHSYICINTPYVHHVYPPFELMWCNHCYDVEHTLYPTTHDAIIWCVYICVIYIYIHMYVYMYVCMYVCMYIYIYIYTHAYNCMCVDIPYHTISWFAK